MFLRYYWNYYLWSNRLISGNYEVIPYCMYVYVYILVCVFSSQLSA